jgi:hypothetical protein
MSVTRRGFLRMIGIAPVAAAVGVAPIAFASGGIVAEAGPLPLVGERVAGFVPSKLLLGAIQRNTEVWARAAARLEHDRLAYDRFLRRG